MNNLEKKINFDIKSYTFHHDFIKESNADIFIHNYWPVVYILSNKHQKWAYIGETIDTNSRITAHLNDPKKKDLKNVHVITSDKFNKSVALDFESKLIRYIAGDGHFKLMNGNLGVRRHNYYQKKTLYSSLFKSIWDELHQQGIVKHSLKQIDNSNLFKYSPYKHLYPEQLSGLLTILTCLNEKKFQHIIMEGGAGTGKTILAIYLFKLLTNDNNILNDEHLDEKRKDVLLLVRKLKKVFPSPKMALVIPMRSFRKTLQKVFKTIDGLSANMIIGPSEVSKMEYDIILVDEAHRLRKRKNLGSYYKVFDDTSRSLNLNKNRHSELDWVKKQSKKLILFYDPTQSIKPSDTNQSDFDALKNDKETTIQELKSQFRVQGGNDYSIFLNQLWNCSITKPPTFSNSYELVLFESFQDMVNTIKEKDRTHGLCRLIAGYSWPWKSQKNKAEMDITIDGVNLQWNSTNEDWILSKNAVNEVGCIHTTQGYDLNYAGIIIGHDIGYDPSIDNIVIYKENYFDKNGKHGVEDLSKLKTFIINIYKTIMLRGIKGTYLYICNDELRAYMSQYIETKLPCKPKFEQELNTVISYKNYVPLYDLNAAAGLFSDTQIIDSYQRIPLPNRYSPSDQLFACKVIGESMNQLIPNESVCLFRKYTGGTRNGKVVLAELLNYHDPDMGSCYTVKKYYSSKSASNNTWTHTDIVLKPVSYSNQYQPIIVEKNDIELLRIIGIFECVIE